MSKKTKTVIDMNVPVTEPVVEVVAEKVTCGHINKHFYNYGGKLEDLTCELPKGHSGNHQAKYQRKAGTPVVDSKGVVQRQEYHAEETTGSWSDAAGVPAAQVYVGQAEQMTLYQRDLVMQVLQKNPRMNIDDALKAAKQSEEWKQVSGLK